MANSVLFPNKPAALAKLKRALAFGPVASLGLNLAALTDDDLWEKLLSAEAWVAAALRVPLVPTRFFTSQPTPDQLAALPEGMPWADEPGYDYDPANYTGDRWGFIALRNRPLIQVHQVRFAYPTTHQTVIDLPLEWVRSDKKAATIQFVPTSALSIAGLGGVMMGFMSAGRGLPFVVQCVYDAGLSEASGLYPAIRDVVMKRALVVMLEDSFMPQSSSISADGLSQSQSVEIAKYHEAVDNAINGGDGNGGLMARIHGVRVMIA